MPEENIQGEDSQIILFTECQQDCQIPQNKLGRVRSRNGKYGNCT